MQSRLFDATNDPLGELNSYCSIVENLQVFLRQLSIEANELYIHLSIPKTEKKDLCEYNVPDMSC